MKKGIVITFLILLVLVFIKYIISDYTINYEVNGYNVKTIYKNRRYYINIDNRFSFDIYRTRSIKRLKIKSIKKIEDENLECVYPEINNTKTYPLCYYNNEYTDYNLINSEVLKDYKIESDNHIEGNFYFNKNLSKDEFIYLWNYRGFYKMNGNSLETIDLFSEGKMSNTLMYQVNNKILLPNYDEAYEFNSFYVINMVNGKQSIITSKHDISYNSYILGNINNKVYLFDQKSLCLYEINIKNLSVKLIGSEELGYYNYKDKKETVSVNVYKNKELVEVNHTSNYKYEIIDNSLYKTINGDDLNLKIFEGENIKIISEYDNNLYFVSNDIFYKYTPSTISKIFNYFELKFNENNIIYILGSKFQKSS